MTESFLSKCAEMTDEQEIRTLLDTVREGWWGLHGIIPGGGSMSLCLLMCIVFMSALIFFLFALRSSIGFCGGDVCGGRGEAVILWLCVSVV